MYYMFLLFLFLLKKIPDSVHSNKEQQPQKNNKNKNNPPSCCDLIDFTNINMSMSYAKQ